MRFQQLTTIFESDDLEYKLKQANSAANTQRGIPENTMLEVVHRLYQIPCPQIIKWGLEHYGDLAHRAQQMRQSIANVHEKLTNAYSKSIKGVQGMWSAKEEIEKNLEESVIYHMIESEKYDIPKGPTNYNTYQYVREHYPQEINQNKEQAISEIVKQLQIYIDAHEKHNLPVTLLGRKGKEFAITFAQYCISVLTKKPTEKYYLLRLQILQNEMLQWVSDFYAIKDEMERDKKFLEGFQE